jgi:hypothetical protein
MQIANRDEVMKAIEAKKPHKEVSPNHLAIFFYAAGMRHLQI